ncbi:MAG: GH32 C-terminal domain-containing protein, partial [Planctomycetes bacterium]|nr:GH32 C-terminal domain-containing protein [Planctomycetota bacterium]
SVSAAAAEPDILIADFEGDTYGDWKVTGEAFGPGPARGTLHGQMAVSGFEGRGLVNTFYKGDGSTGTLTSPEFTIERNYVNFLIGGGAHKDKTCINLLVDGKVVRTAVGPNAVPGGSEELDWASWDVAELAGKQAVIQIVDQATGGWGHINIDQIVQADRKLTLETIARELTVDKPLLHLPVKTGAKKRLMRLVVDGKMVREFVIELAKEEPDFWTYTEVDQYLGKTMRIEVDKMPPDSTALEALELADQRPDPEGTYGEPLRPQFHFTPARGWTNDPNGLMYYDGQYHLFFQHNPFGVNWGNMTWGHAVSPDMFHWRQLPDAIHQDALGTIFSGAGVVDQGNTAGWQTGDEKVLVAIYTSAGGTNAESQGEPFTQSVAYSSDRGRTWRKFDGNPVLGHIAGRNRDPKVIYHEPTKRWVMALFLDGNEFALFTSPDLKQWERTCDVAMPDTRECPDFFPLAVDGDSENVKWVFWGANGNYRIGRFDGQTFTPETDVLKSKWGQQWYAAQTYSDMPKSDGRRIIIAWMAGGQYPGMPFNQQMSTPCVLSLRTTDQGIRLYRRPVEELAALHQEHFSFADAQLAPGKNPLSDLSGDLFDIHAEIALADAAEVGFSIRGNPITYSVKEKQLSAFGKTAPLAPVDGAIKLQIVVDRRSVEVFGNDGRVAMEFCFQPDAENKTVELFAREGSARIESLDVWKVKSVWSR